jgi:hypothetical protein
LEIEAARSRSRSAVEESTASRSGSVRWVCVFEGAWLWCGLLFRDLEFVLLELVLWREAVVER